MTVDPTLAGRSYSAAASYVVGREVVRQFAGAVGADHPLHHDVAAARQAGFGDVVAPPTFAVVVAQPATDAMMADPGTGLEYARIVHECAMLRQLIGVAHEIAEIGYSRPDDVVKAVDSAETLMYEVGQGRVSDTLKQIRDLLDDNLDRLEQLYERGDSITGTPSGYSDLDDLLSGLQPNALLVVGARPAMGKALALDTPIPTPASTAGRLSAVSTCTGSRSASSRGSTHCTPRPIAVPSAAPSAAIPPACSR